MKSLINILNKLAIAVDNPCSRQCPNGQIRTIEDLLILACKSGFMAPMLEPPYLGPAPLLEPAPWSSKYGPDVYAVLFFDDSYIWGAVKIKRFTSGGEGCCCVQCVPQMVASASVCNSMNGFFTPGSNCSEFSGNCCKQHTKDSILDNVAAHFTAADGSCWGLVEQAIPCYGETFVNEPDAWKMLLWANNANYDAIENVTNPNAKEFHIQQRTVRESERWGDGTCEDCTPQSGNHGWGTLQCYMKEKYNVSCMQPSQSPCS